MTPNVPAEKPGDEATGELDEPNADPAIDLADPAANDGETPEEGQATPLAVAVEDAPNDEEAKSGSPTVVVIEGDGEAAAVRG